MPDSGPAQDCVSAGGRGACSGRAGASRRSRRRLRRRSSAPAEKKKAEQAQGSDLAQLAAPGRPDARDRLPADSAGGREAGRPAAEPGALAAPPSLGGDGLSGAPGAHLGQSAPASRASICSRCAASRSAAGRPRGRSCWRSRATRTGVRWPARRRGSRPSAFPRSGSRPALEDQAIAAGYSVVDAVTVITTHLGELIRRHAWELLGRAEIKRLMDSLNESHPKLMEELVPKLLTLGEVGRVLEQLLRERVSIRDLGAILEALLETAAGEQEPGGPGRGRAPGAGPTAGAAAARRRRPAAGAAARSGARRGDSGHAVAGDRPAAADRGRGCRERPWSAAWPIL